MANETTTKFKVDISELKKGIQEANRQIRLANAEFKSASASMDSWGKSTDGLTAKINQTDKVLKAQKAILNDYKKQLALIVAEYGENSKEADEMRIKIENQRATVIKTQKSLGEYKAQLSELEAEQKKSADAAEKQASAYDTLKSKIGEQEKQLEALKTEYANVVLEQGKESAAAKELGGKIDELSGDLKENKDKLKEAADAADDLDQSLEETSSGGVSTFSVALGNLIANVVSSAISKLKDLVTETINVGKSFDSSMSQVAAVSGATGDELQALRDKAKEMGATTQFTASEAADAFNYMAMAGWKTEQMIDGIPGVLNLAAASGTDLATTSDIVTDALTAMGYAAEDAGRLADVMAAASSNANTNVQMMGETFKYAAPVTGALGYSMEDTAIAVGLMANSGIKASQAGTSLRGTLSRLTKPTKEMTATMAELGLIVTDTTNKVDSDKLKKAQNSVANKTAAMEKAQISYNAAVKKYGADSDQARKAMIGLETAQRNLTTAQEELAKVQNGQQLTTYKNTTLLQNEQGEMLSLMEVMQLLREKMGGLDEAQQAQAASALFGQEAMSGMLAIINASEGDFNKLTEAVKNSEGAAESMAGTMLDNLGGDMTKLGSQFEGVQLAIYEKFEPALRKGVEALSGLLDAVSWLVAHGSEVTAVITGIAAAVGTYVAYTTALQIMKNGWMSLAIVQKAVAAGQAALNAVMAMNPIGLVVAAIAGLVAAFVVLWKKSEAFRNFWLGLWETIKDAAGAAWEWIKETFGAIGEFFSGIWSGISEGASALWDAVTGFFSDGAEAVKGVWSSISGFFSGIWDGIKAIWSTVAKWFDENVVQPIIAFFTPLVEFFSAAWNIIKELAVGCWETIKIVWSAVTEWFKTNIIDPVVTFFTELWDNIKNAAQAAWDFIAGVWQAVSEWFDTNVIQPVAQFFVDLWDGIGAAASAAWDFIKSVWQAVSGWFKNTIIQPVANFFTGMWDGLKNGASKAWDGIKSVFGGVADWFRDKFSKAWQAVKDVFSTGGKVFDGIKDGIVSAFKTVVNAIIRGINKVIAIPFNAINGILDKIQGVSILGLEPFKNLVHRLPVPEIPELARGGVLKRGQVGLLEGDGAEAVVPLENNKRWIAATAAELKKALMSEGIIGGTPVVPAPVTNNYNFTQNNTSPKALSRLDIYRQSKNLLRMKGAT